VPAAPDVEELRSVPLSAMIFVISSRSRHLSFSGQYFPFPYAPSMAAASRVTSSASFGSAGAARVSPSFKSFILRATSGSSFKLS
jgi:hypothetical protein